MTESSRQGAAAPRAHHTLPTLIAAGLIAVGGLGWGGWWLLAGQYRETTEDAYVDGNVVQVTALTAGTVTAIGADNTDTVPAGKELVTLDDNDARTALQRAEAQLAKTVRLVSGQFASAAQMRATLAMRAADLARARQDMQIRAPLVKTGAVSAEEYRHSEETLQSAEAALAAAAQQSAGTAALVDKVTVADHPDVAAAAMQVRDAYLDLQRTHLRAPLGGMVTHRVAQVGQRVSAGTPLMSLVALDQLWVTANFKESQLSNLRVGQTVKLSADVYGGSVVYTGHIVGLDAGTGSAFTLMPAQNATGNWIKVVQRLPVRIALSPAELAAHPLRLGLSVRVDAETGDRSGAPLSVVRVAAPHGYATDAFRAEGRGADALTQAIIRANLTGAAGKGRPA
jgi:membrane fusion protein (multidrug efflux system)